MLFIHHINAINIFVIKSLQIMIKSVTIKNISPITYIATCQEYYEKEEKDKMVLYIFGKWWKSVRTGMINLHQAFMPSCQNSCLASQLKLCISVWQLFLFKFLDANASPVTWSHQNWKPLFGQEFLSCFFRIISSSLKQLYSNCCSKW